MKIKNLKIAQNYEIPNLTLVVHSLRPIRWGLSHLSSRPSSSEVAQSNVRADRARDGVHEYLVVASMVSELVVALHDHDGNHGRLEQARDDE